MEVGKEVQRVVYDFSVDLTEREKMLLFEHARREMTEEEFENIMVEWAMVNIIKQDFEEKGILSNG